MSKIKRYIHDQITSDLKEKMVFIGGPRQVGKTFLSKQFIEKDSQYLNWDRFSDKNKILKDQLELE